MGFVPGGKHFPSGTFFLKPIDGTADGTMSGALTGSWTYDEAKKQLKLGNVIVCVEREVDWEASPRRVTFVYAGTEKNLNATYWGKMTK